MRAPTIRAAHREEMAAVACGTMTDHADDHTFERLKTESSMAKFALPIIVLHIAMGTAFFANMEEWSWPDAAYFSAVTLTTVGYGDLTPTLEVSKVFAIFYIIVGLSLVATSLGAFVGSIQGKIEAVTINVTPLSAAQRYILSATRSLVVLIIVITAGAVFVYFNEGWGMLDSVYWAVVTASSVGYGDETIMQESTRIFGTVYVLFAVGAFAVSLSKLGSIIVDVEAQRNVDSFVARGVSLGMLEDIKQNCNREGDMPIDRIEFLQYMLVAMGKVQQEDIDKVLNMFDVLDEDGSGQLDAADIHQYRRKQSIGTLSQQHAAAAAAAAAAFEAKATVEAPADPEPINPVSRTGSSWLGSLAKPLLGGD